MAGVRRVCFYVLLLLSLVITDILLFDAVDRYRKPETADPYDVVRKDMVYFPVPESTYDTDGYGVSYVDSWMADRSYGGQRSHEGCDIMAAIDKRGHYPIVSISDGYVEKMGWLKLGGYRIGIRSPRGVYFYYAHLSDYAPDLEVGDEIKAGELLGFMGDTGYGDVEGTTGNFPVHLHLGIYLNDENGEEQVYNPYPFLQELESKKLKFSYE